MDHPKSKKEGTNSNFSSPILKSLLSSQNIYILTFDSNGQILDSSEGLKIILDNEPHFYEGKNIDTLPLSKSEKPLVLLNFKKGFPSSQKIYDVKLITGQGRILTMNISIELSFSNENLIGGVVHFEIGKQNLQAPNAFNNIMSKSKFFLKEPLRISKHFAEKLADKISDKESTKNEYLTFIIDNISSLDSLVNHLIILENLNIYKADLKPNKFEEIVIIGIQETKERKVNFQNITSQKQIFCDRDLMKLLITMTINISRYYTKTDPSFIKIEEENLQKKTKLIFRLGAISFLDHPSFAPNLPLKRIGNLKDPKTSGYELVIINQIVKLHKGSLKISINNENETEIEIKLPNQI